MSIGSIRHNFNSLASTLIAGSVDPGCRSQSTIDIAGKEKVMIIATAGNGGRVARGGRYSIRPCWVCSMGKENRDSLLWRVTSCRAAESSILGCYS